MSMTAIEDMFDAMWVMIITMTTVGYGGKYPYTSSGKVTALMSAILGSLYMAMPLTIVGNKFYDIYEQVEAQKAKAQLKSARMTYEMQKKKKAKVTPKVTPKSTKAEQANMDTLKAFKLGHVVTLKRWVYRTKKKLEVQMLNEDERTVLLDYLKTCRKICRQTRFRRDELESFKSQHKDLIVVLSKHLIHKHAEGIDTVESTLY